MPSSGRTAAQDRWLRFFNDVVYNVAAPAYNAIDWLTLGAWWRLVRHALDYVPANKSVLEIGFGPGKLHLELARRASWCHGLDRAAGMCFYARRRLRRAGLVTRLAQGSVFALPYRANVFDVVVSTFALSGLPRGTDAMHEMARVARTGGCVVLVDIGLPTDKNPTGTFLARLWEWMGDYLYDQRELMQLADLKITAFEEYGPGRHIRSIVGTKLT